MDPPGPRGHSRDARPGLYWQTPGTETLKVGGAGGGIVSGAQHIVFAGAVPDVEAEKLLPQILVSYPINGRVAVM